MSQIYSTDRLPSMSLFVPFAKATGLMQPDFEQVLQSLPSVSCIISDGFLSWKQKSASKFGIPRAIWDKQLRREHLPCRDS
uniref:Uncharacterized protein n=1 Tax=Nelumbo nucifera TaxID=4432 RepID=A0A822ZPU3_NELNU|nr:TPA_asm: hypothetical protein HUJ06_016437 [Nelumbo nucifera]